MAGATAILHPLALAAVLVLAAVPALGSSPPDVVRVPVLAGGVTGIAVLDPFDPRDVALVAIDPRASAGIYRGAVGDATLTLVTEPDGAVGVLARGDVASWVTIERGIVVPLDIPATAESSDAEITLPGDADLPPAPAGGRDGALQLAFVGDAAYVAAWGPRAASHAVQVFALVDAIYRANLRVPVEVVSTELLASDDGLTGPVRCDGSSGDLLDQLRRRGEARAPTLASPHELTHAFTARGPVPHPLGGVLWGCGYVRALESPFAYSASYVVASNPGTGATRVPVASLAIDATLVAHEIGHNFGGLHRRAMPTPTGSSCPATSPTIMFPYVSCRNVPAFSDGENPAMAPLEARGYFVERGNAPHMRAHAADRI